MSVTLRGRIIARSQAQQGKPALVVVRFFIDEYTSTDLTIENRKGWELDDEVEAVVRNIRDDKKLEIV